MSCPSSQTPSSTVRGSIWPFSTAGTWPELARARGPCRRLILLYVPPSFLVLRVRHDLAMLMRASPGLSIHGNGQRVAMQCHCSTIATVEPKSGDPPLHLHLYLTQFNAGSMLVPSVSPATLPTASDRRSTAASARLQLMGGANWPAGPSCQCLRVHCTGCT
jgi:hypothetical protein